MQEIDNDLRKEVSKVQTAYNDLLEVAELAPLPTTITHITTAWLSSIIEAKCNLIDNDTSLTFDEKKSRKKAWFAVHSKAAKAIKAIVEALQSYPDADWDFDPMISPSRDEYGERATSHKGNFFCKNIEQVAASRSDHVVPDEAKEHWQLINQALEQIRKLRAWEDDHDIKSQPLAYHQELPAYQFLEAWITGAVKFDRKFAHLGINPRNYKDPKNPDRVII